MSEASAPSGPRDACIRTISNTFAGSMKCRIELSGYVRTPDGNKNHGIGCLMSMHGGGTAQVCERTFLPLVAMLHGSCFLVGAGAYQIKPELVQASTAIDIPSATEMRPLPCRSILVCPISPGKDRRNGESKQAGKQASG